MTHAAAKLRERYERRIGQWVGKYRLRALLGVGGMAAVFEATHRNGNAVAVKILHAELSVDAETRGRFQREGYLANKVAHRGVVRVLDDDEADDGTVFLVMELLEGETLEKRFVRSGDRLGVSEVAAIARQLLEVLARAHQRGIVHRDIKPENVFLTHDGVVKILDFGIARLRERSGAPSTTATGVLMGTPAFMAPEQALGKKNQIDGQTDLWAVSATMFTLLSGALVHDAESSEEMIVRTATAAPRKLRAVAPDVPAPIAEVVDRGLAFEKCNRWADADAMRRALEEAYESVFGVPISDVAPLGEARPSASIALAPTEPRRGTGLSSARTVAIRRSAVERRVLRRLTYVLGGLTAIACALLAALVRVRGASHAASAVAPAAPRVVAAIPVDEGPPAPPPAPAVDAEPPASRPLAHVLPSSRPTARPAPARSARPAASAASALAASSSPAPEPPVDIFKP